MWDQLRWSIELVNESVNGWKNHRKTIGKW